MVQRYEQMRRLQWYKRGAAYFSYHFIFCVLAKNKMKRKRHLLDNQINVNLLTKIYFSVIFLLAIKLKSISNLHEHLSSLFWFVATEGVSVVSLMFLSCLRQVYEVYILKKVTSILATFFSILCFLFIF